MFTPVDLVKMPVKFTPDFYEVIVDSAFDAVKTNITWHKFRARLYTNNSLYLARKYVQIFVLLRYLFLELS